MKALWDALAAIANSKEAAKLKELHDAIATVGGTAVVSVSGRVTRGPLEGHRVRVSVEVDPVENDDG